MSSETQDPYHRLMTQYNELAALAGSLAHEIKNPLSIIRMNMDLLAEDLADAETTGEHRARNKIQVVQDQCKRLETLPTSLAQLTKLEVLDISDCVDLTIPGPLEVHKSIAVGWDDDKVE